jgi:metal-dependent amidase/aminoacylase/carboxypeptidase family protein
MSEVNEEATELIEKIQKDRSRMFDLISSKTELLSNTAEGMANEQKVFKYISLCLCNEEGKSLFAGQEDLEQYAADNRDDFSELVQKAYAIVYGIDSDRDITEDWAEVQFFRNISKESETKSVAKSKKRKKTTKNTAKKTTKKTTKKNTNKVD